MKRSPDGRAAARLKRRLAWLRTPDAHRLLLGVVVVLVHALLLAANTLSTLRISVGARAPFDVRAPRHVSFVDEAATDALRDEAERKIQPLYREDPKLTSRVMENLSLVFRLARTRPEGETAAQRVARLKEEVPFDFDDDTLLLLARADAPVLQALEQKLSAAVEEVLGQGIREGTDDLRRREADVVKMIQEMGLNRRYRAVLEDVALAVLQPNWVLDLDGTRQRREAARREVAEVMQHIAQGEIVVHKGEVVSEAAMAKLRVLGFLSPLANVRTWGAVIVLSLLIVVFLSVLVRTIAPDIFRQVKQLMVIALLFLLALSSVKATGPFLYGVLAIVAPLSVVMILTLLMGSGLAVGTAAVLAFDSALILGQDVTLGFTVLMGGVACAASLKEVEQRADLYRAGLWVAVAAWATYSSLLLMHGEELMQIAVSGGATFLSAWGSSILAAGLLFPVERIFGLVSPLRLLELSNATHPLLRRLMREAPGTYNHTMYVANLAEAAAQEVGANRLLARVGSYYHDIGKTIRPYFFIENQIHMGNVHEGLTPAQSAEYIRSHVTDGIALGKQYGLPSQIIAFIPEHHGDSRISFFYDQLDEEDKLQVSEERFCYPGPKPQSKETAICMLADGVEASVRAMQHPTTVEAIENQIRKIIRRRMETGQLDECSLTFRDLGKIEKAFLHLLVGMYHPRIAYPEKTSAPVEPQEASG